MELSLESYFHAPAIEVPLKIRLSHSNTNNLNLLELLYFSHTADPDRILETIGFGRAHHRLAYFINRQPGMTAAELLDLLQITKQNLTPPSNNSCGAGNGLT